MDGYLDYLHVKEIQKDRLAAVRRREGDSEGRRRFSMRLILAALQVGRRP